MKFANFFRTKYYQWAKRLLVLALLFLAGLICYHLPVRLSPPVTELIVSPQLKDHVIKQQLTIACYNIAHGRGGQIGESNWNKESNKQRLKRLADIKSLIKHHNPDILVLNECDFKTSWSYEVSQGKFIAQDLYKYLICQSNYKARIPTQTWNFGNALLTNCKILKYRFVDLSPHSRIEELVAGDKNSCIVSFETSNQVKFRVMLIHLDPRDENVRLQSAETILKIESQDDSPLLLVGDFNSTLKTMAGHQKSNNGLSAMDALTSSGRFKPAIASHPAQLTFPASRPTRRIDWILIPHHWQSSHSIVIPSPLSDHCYIQSTLKIPVSH